MLFIIVVVIFGFFLYLFQTSAAWDSSFLKFIRWLLFIPLSFLMIGFILSIPNIVFNMIYDLVWWQILLILFFAVGIMIAFFQTTIYFGTEMVLKLCPHRKTGAISTIIVSLIASVSYIINVWSVGDLDAINYRSDFHSIGVTIFNLILLGFIIFSSILYYKDEY